MIVRAIPTRRTVLVALAAGGLIASGAAAGSASAAPSAPSRAAPVSREVPAPSSTARTQPARRPPIERRLNPSNPLVGLRWGTSWGPHEPVMDAYRAARGTQRQLLSRVALHPKAHWFGPWTQPKDLRSLVRRYIASATGGRRNVLVQLTVFRMWPWEHVLCGRLPTPTEVAQYKHWINVFARAVGRTHAAIILQPDGPFALCAPHHSRLPSRLVAYAARRFDALANTTVYVEAGSADWASVADAEKLLQRGGIARSRGFALNTTHYDSTVNEIAYGTRIVRALARHGIRNKHFVINTVDNARPFTFQHAPGPTHGTPRVCKSRTERRCVTLGIPPTWHVADPQWRLPARSRRLAARHVDAYLWYGRPWLRGGKDPFLLQRTLWMCRTTPFQG